MQPGTRTIASLATAGIGGVAAALAGAPWWITVGAYGCFVLALIVVVVQTIFPQESADRLEWWRDRRRHQLLAARKNAASTKPPTAQCARRKQAHRRRAGRLGRAVASGSGSDSPGSLWGFIIRSPLLTCGFRRSTDLGHPQFE